MGVLQVILYISLVLLLVVGIVSLIIGILGYRNGKVLRWSVSRTTSISLMAIGGSIIGLSLLLFGILLIFDIYTSRKHISRIITSGVKYPDDLNIFTRMLFSTNYDQNSKGIDIVYLGGNYRGKGDYYKKFFNQELAKGLPREIEEYKDTGEKLFKETGGDQINTSLLLFIWYLFTQYLENRFDINNARKILKYNLDYYKNVDSLSFDDHIVIKSYGEYYKLAKALYRFRKRKLIPKIIYDSIYPLVEKIINVMNNKLKKSSDRLMIEDINSNIENFKEMKIREIGRNHRTSEVIKGFLNLQY